MANSNITKKALAQSLKELGSTKILDKITVADITNHCGVNRQTFYYHFNDKYELLNWIYTEDLFKPLTKDLDFFNWGDKLVGLLKYMKNMKNSSDQIMHWILMICCLRPCSFSRHRKMYWNIIRSVSVISW